MNGHPVTSQFILSKDEESIMRHIGAQPQKPAKISDPPKFQQVSPVGCYQNPFTSISEFNKTHVGDITLPDFIGCTLEEIDQSQDSFHTATELTNTIEQISTSNELFFSCSDNFSNKILRTTSTPTKGPLPTFTTRFCLADNTNKKQQPDLITNIVNHSKLKMPTRPNFNQFTPIKSPCDMSSFIHSPAMSDALSPFERNPLSNPQFKRAIPLQNPRFQNRMKLTPTKHLKEASHLDLSFVPTLKPPEFHLHEKSQLELDYAPKIHDDEAPLIYSKLQEFPPNTFDNGGRSEPNKLPSGEFPLSMEHTCFMGLESKKDPQIGSVSPPTANEENAYANWVQRGALFEIEE